MLSTKKKNLFSIEQGGSPSVPMSTGAAGGAGSDGGYRGMGGGGTVKQFIGGI